MLFKGLVVYLGLVSGVFNWQNYPVCDNSREFHGVGFQRGREAPAPMNWGAEKTQMKRKLAKGTRPEGSRRQDGEGLAEQNSAIRTEKGGAE